MISFPDVKYTLNELQKIDQMFCDMCYVKHFVWMMKDVSINDSNYNMCDCRFVIEKSLFKILEVLKMICIRI